MIVNISEDLIFGIADLLYSVCLRYIFLDQKRDSVHPGWLFNQVVEFDDKAAFWRDKTTFAVLNHKYIHRLFNVHKKKGRPTRLFPNQPRMAKYEYIYSVDCLMNIYI